MILAAPPTSVGPSINSMKERHHEIKRRLVAGDRQVDIAKSLGMTQAWLSIVVSSPMFQAELAILRAEADRIAADISGRLDRLAPDAMSVLEKAIRETPEGISAFQKTVLARDVLDRKGYVKPVAPSQATANVRVEIVQFTAPTAAQPKAVIIEAHASQEGV